MQTTLVACAVVLVAAALLCFLFKTGPVQNRQAETALRD
ncbi:hypothetical protein H4W80_000796 [Nonomuraea angiospora]|uniref:Uncharacterized protein n=1 Tax=Nonomuraea angiospora TaxID=46172 RepID=A0ABR9LQH4_9ACTN|nr:hypothetical protein [Nonomuraea angiospora]